MVANADNTVSVLLGNGNGTFQKPADLSPRAAARSASPSPIMGDGKPDVVADFFDNTVSVLLGNGNGTFKTQQTYAAGNRTTIRRRGGSQRRWQGDLIVTN